jgi:hypothetical protein
MSAIQVDIHHRTHTCPADPEPHPYDTSRTVLVAVPAGPCRRPVTIHSGDTTAVVACGRHVPREQRCPVCRITVVEHAITATHTGHHGRGAQPCQPAPTGFAGEPCRICGEPLAAALADYGTHLLCQPRRRTKPAAVQLAVPGLQHSTNGNAASS